jgi:hypothetical protein
LLENGTIAAAPVRGGQVEKSQEYISIASRKGVAPSEMWI